MGVYKERVFKTTVEIYTDYDPTQSRFDDLAREAIEGDAFYCNRKCDRVPIDKVPEEVLEFLGIGEPDLDEGGGSNKFGGDTGNDADMNHKDK